MRDRCIFTTYSKKDIVSMNKQPYETKRESNRETYAMLLVFIENESPQGKEKKENCLNIYSQLAISTFNNSVLIFRLGKKIIFSCFKKQHVFKFCLRTNNYNYCFQFLFFTFRKAVFSSLTHIILYKLSFITELNKLLCIIF